MTLLFRRAARIVIGTIELVVDPTDPAASLDVAFNVERSLKPEPNTCEAQVWNLNADHRSQLEEAGAPPKTKSKSKKPEPKPPKGVPCTIEAGYEEQTALLFSGTLRTVFSMREGADIVTTLQSGDGEKEYQRSRINLSIAKKTPNASLLKQIVKALGIGEGNLASITSALPAAPLFPAGGVLSGSASQIMTRIAQSLGFEWSIQDGALQILEVSSPILGTAVLLTPDTGLVGSPSVDSEGVLSAQCLLIPDIFPGRLLVLESERLKGSYRVDRCNYSGNTAGADWYIDLEAKKL